MPHTPAVGVRASEALLRPAVGGRRSPVTARGRAVLDETRRRMDPTELQLEVSQVARSTR